MLAHKHMQETEITNNLPKLAFKDVVSAPWHMLLDAIHYAKENCLHTREQLSEMRHSGKMQSIAKISRNQFHVNVLQNEMKETSSISKSKKGTNS